MSRSAPSWERPDLPVALWLGLPAAAIGVTVLVLPLAGPGWWHTLALSERTGFLENGTVVLLAAAIAWGVRLLRRRREMPALMTPLLAVFVLGTLYFAGEEASWGQHWLGFPTPAAQKALNTHGEFNLHNREDLREYLNALPRRAVMLATVAGAVLAPLALQPWRRRLAGRWPWLDWLVPTWRIVPVGLAATCFGLPHRALAALGVALEGSPRLYLALEAPSQEFRELGFAMVILLYVLSLHARLGPRPAPAWAAVPGGAALAGRGGEEGPGTDAAPAAAPRPPSCTPAAPAVGRTADRPREAPSAPEA